MWLSNRSGCLEEGVYISRANWIMGPYAYIHIISANPLKWKAAVPIFYGGINGRFTHLSAFGALSLSWFISPRRVI